MTETTGQVTTTDRRRRPALGRNLATMRLVGGSADRTAERAAAVLPSAVESAGAKGWPLWAPGAAALAADERRRAEAAELDALRDRVSALERDLRCARADHARDRAGWDREREVLEQRAVDAARAARHDAHAAVKHDGRLTSILPEAWTTED